MTAPFESDSICAKFVINNIAYACLSDDMDLFVYGCTRVLRNLNVSNYSVVLYDYKKILKSLKINDNNFKKITKLPNLHLFYWIWKTCTDFLIPNFEMLYLCLYFFMPI